MGLPENTTNTSSIPALYYFYPNKVAAGIAVPISSVKPMGIIKYNKSFILKANKKYQFYFRVPDFDDGYNYSSFLLLYFNNENVPYVCYTNGENEFKTILFSSIQQKDINSESEYGTKAKAIVEVQFDTDKTVYPAILILNSGKFEKYNIQLYLGAGNEGVLEETTANELREYEDRFELYIDKAAPEGYYIEHYWKEGDK